MDSLDVRILRLLLQGQALSPLNPDFRASFTAIAERVGVDPDTVRHRVKKLHETGLLADWRLALNPRIWGGGQLALFLEPGSDSTKDELIEELRLVPGVIIITRFYGRLGVVLEYEDERSVPRQVELIRRMSTADDLSIARYPFPECRATLSARDWELIRALRRNPRKSCVALAREVGLSSRTVKRKLARMTEDGVAYAWPALNLKAAGNSVIAWLLVMCPGDRKKEIDEAITARLDDCTWHISHWLPYRPGEPHPTSYELAVPSLHRAVEILRWAEQIPGVDKVRLDLYETVFTNFAWYDEYLDEKLRRMPTVLSQEKANANRRSLIVPARE